MKHACVIGNGPSRLQFDLHCINASMYTYGCNALYRDFMPDYLISMDKQMIQEILDNKVQYKTKFYTQETANFDHMSVDVNEGINWLKNIAKRLDSGNSALEVALDHNYDVIYMIGFDYNIADKLPNVYHGTSNYAKNSSVLAPESLTRDWQQRLRRLVKEHSNTQIVRVNGSNTPMTTNETNYSEITPEQFKEIYDSRN